MRALCPLQRLLCNPYLSESLHAYQPTSLMFCSIMLAGTHGMTSQEKGFMCGCKLVAREPCLLRASVSGVSN